MLRLKCPKIMVLLNLTLIRTTIGQKSNDLLSAVVSNRSATNVSYRLYL